MIAAAHRQQRIFCAANEAQASGPTICKGPFQSPGRGPKEIFTFVPNVAFVILYSFP